MLNFAFVLALLSWLFKTKVVLTAVKTFCDTVEDVSCREDCNVFDNVCDNFNDDTINIEFKELDQRVLFLNKESSLNTTELF